MQRGNKKCNPYVVVIQQLTVAEKCSALTAGEGKRNDLKQLMPMDSAFLSEVEPHHPSTWSTMLAINLR
jgi:hypothetical protein